MNNCERLLDAMPDVAARRTTWSDHDAAHISDCAECGASWTIIAAAGSVGTGTTIDVSLVATTLQRRLHAAPVAAPLNRWSRIALGAAAAALIGVGLSSSFAGNVAPRDDAAAIETAVMFPELEALSEPQLEVILATVAEPDSVIDGGAGLPRLGDLNDAQLEELILSVEGE